MDKIKINLTPGFLNGMFSLPLVVNRALHVNLCSKSINF
jgi:hypothetical protein